MRGISEKQLEDARNNAKLNWDARRSIDIVLHLIPLSELQEPWMTLDEFLKSGFIGKCWVNIAFTSYFANFNGIDFVENPCIESKFPVKHITHVMPIHKPEPPR